jgi:hypothetical protein
VQTKIVDPLHKMPLTGTVHAQFVRCGRPNCRCREGHLHGPYFYRFWREGGKLRKEYVRPKDVNNIRAQCEARREARQHRRAGWDAWRNLVVGIREVEYA